MVATGYCSFLLVTKKLHRWPAHIPVPKFKFRQKRTCYKNAPCIWNNLPRFVYLSIFWQKYCHHGVWGRVTNKKIISTTHIVYVGICNNSLNFYELYILGKIIRSKWLELKKASVSNYISSELVKMGPYCKLIFQYQ